MQTQNEQTETVPVQPIVSQPPLYEWCLNSNMENPLGEEFSDPFGDDGLYFKSFIVPAVGDTIYVCPRVDGKYLRLTMIVTKRLHFLESLNPEEWSFESSGGDPTFIEVYVDVVHVENMSG
jgi:hypothetical protein